MAIFSAAHRVTCGPHIKKQASARAPQAGSVVPLVFWENGWSHIFDLFISGFVLNRPLL
jgi:hypothetical protein